jgi:hypothetical protein
MVSNPFSAPAKPSAGSTTTEVESQRAIAETQAAVLMAKRFPRDQKEAMDKILTACTRSSLAESATYTYSRGGSDISGPSIRLAETIAQLWGNLQFGIRELSQHGGESEVEAFAWDIETNTRQTKLFKVKHERHTKKGSYKLTDPRDIYELVANNGARRLRACILGVIPGDVVEAAMDQCDVTLKTKIEITPDLIKSLLEKFGQHGVTKEMIEKRIQRNIDSVTPALVVSLRKIFNSLKDGMASPGDFFEIAPGPNGKAPTNNINTADEKTKPDRKPSLEEQAAAAAKGNNGEIPGI